MPQVIQYHNTPEQLETALGQAIDLLGKYELDSDTYAALLPKVVELLAEKAVGLIPDAPTPELARILNGLG